MPVKCKLTFVLCRVRSLTSAIRLSFVCSMLADNMTAKVPTLFRTYIPPENRSFDCELWEAARATAATPTYFESIAIGLPGNAPRYVDGGIGCNNPINQLRHEASLVFRDRKVACIVSIGSGQASTIHLPKRGILQRSVFQKIIPLDFINAAKSMAVDCEEKHEECARFFEMTPNLYFRFNVERGLEEVGIEEWKKLPEVTAHTHQYMKAQEPGQRLSMAARALRTRPSLVPSAEICTCLNSTNPTCTANAYIKDQRLAIAEQINRKLKQCPAPSRAFTGREDVLRQMELCFTDGNQKQHIFVLYGLGGGGKSQLTFKFVYQSQYDTQPSRSVYISLSD